MAQTVRKDRMIDGERKHGPVHLVNSYDLTWCGRKIKGFASWKDEEKQPVDCADCQRAREKNQPRSWKRR